MGRRMAVEAVVLGGLTIHAIDRLIVTEKTKSVATEDTFSLSPLLPPTEIATCSEDGSVTGLEKICWTSVFCLVLTGSHARTAALRYLYPPNARTGAS